MMIIVSCKVALLSEYLGPVVLCVITVFKPLARSIIIILIIITVRHHHCHNHQDLRDISYMLSSSQGKDHPSRHHCHHHQDLSLYVIINRQGWALSLSPSILLMQSVSGLSTGILMFIVHLCF